VISSEFVENMLTKFLKEKRKRERKRERLFGLFVSSNTHFGLFVSSNTHKYIGGKKYMHTLSTKMIFHEQCFSKGK